MRLSKENLLVLGITLSGAAIRFIGINRPLLGNFATKACVYAMIAKNFARDGFQLLYPSFDVLRSGKPSLHLLEFPWVAYLVGVIHKMAGGNLDFWGRFVSVLFFVCSCYLLYKIVVEMFNSRVALFSLGAFVLIPLNIVYSQSFQLESAMITFILLSLYFIYRWTKEGGGILLFFFGICYALLLLLKVQTLYLLPVLLSFILFNDRKKFKDPVLYVCILLSVIPTLLWYRHVWILDQTVDNVFYSIYDSMRGRSFPDPRIFSSEFYIKLFKNLWGIVFTPAGIVLLALGAFSERANKNQKILYIWAACVAGYFLLMPRKVYEMNYYLMPLVPVGAIFIGEGIDFITNKVKFSKVGASVIVILLTLLSMRYAFNPSFVTPADERHVVSTAKEVKPIIPKESLIIASQGSGRTLLYYMDRKGWPFMAEKKRPEDIFEKTELKYKKDVLLDPVENLEYLREQGAEYFVSSEARKLKKLPLYDYLDENYVIVGEDEDFLIFDLRIKRQ